MNERARLKANIQSLSSDSFEAFVASVWSAMGWSTNVTQSSQDMGVDIVATKSGIYNEKVVIQAKGYSEGNKVGRPEIQQYTSLKQQIPDTDAVIVVTSSDFTSEAKNLAKKLNVKTISGEELVEESLKHLSEEKLETLLPHSDNSSNDRDTQFKEPDEKIPFDELSDSEKDLAKVFRGYYNRYIEDGKNDEQIARRLWFDVNGIEEMTQKGYVVYDQIHLIALKPEDDVLIRRIEKSAQKYGWKVLNRKRVVTERVGVVVPKIIKGESDFSLALDTSRPGETVTPERQAKISSRFISTVFNRELSGMRVAEVRGIDDLRSSATIIA